MAETKTEKKIEREYVIPLRCGWKKVPRYKRAKKAIRTIREFLVQHMKIRDRDLKKIKVDRFLNEEVWFRGIKKPPIKIKVKAIKEGDIVRAELVDYPDNLKFKKLREEKRNKAGEDIKKKKIAETKPEEKKESPEEKKKEEEKVEAVKETGEKLAKQAAKTSKHESKSNAKQPKHQVRKALAK